MRNLPSLRSKPAFNALKGELTWFLHRFFGNALYVNGTGEFNTAIIACRKETRIEGYGGIEM